jgi:thiamine biosynthesis lipoprotein
MSEIRRMRPLLGTYVEIVAQAENGKGEIAIAQAFKAIEEIQQLLSFHRPESDLSRLNLAGGAVVTLHPLSCRVLRLARAVTLASKGLFNCMVGGVLVRQGVLPDHGAAQVLDCGHPDDIAIDGVRVRLKRPVMVTLDGIAKGYAVDRAIQVLRRSGISAGWVNAGGDMRVFGPVVLPVHRRELDGSLTPLGGLQQAAIATSCVRPRPDASFPAWIVGNGSEPELGAWSVLARTAWRADALTKVASLAHPAERSGLIRQLGGRLV